MHIKKFARKISMERIHFPCVILQKLQKKEIIVGNHNLFYRLSRHQSALMSVNLTSPFMVYVVSLLPLSLTNEKLEKSTTT